MIRLISLFAAGLALPAAAQTTLDITVPPGNVVCSYTTGPVTSGSTAGHLQATATGSSGAGCGSGGTGNVTFGPASQLVAVPSTVSGTNGIATLSFQALNATQCVGTIAGAATGTFTGGATFCNSAATCTGVVSKTATFVNTGTTSINDTVTVTCTGLSGQAQSSATVSVSGTGSVQGCSRVIAGAPGTPVASFSQQTGTPLFTYSGVGAQVRADVTQFSSVFPGPFPGSVSNLQASEDLPVANYISMQFTLTPEFAASVPTGAYYQFSQGLSDYASAESFTISTSCGDFSNPSNYANSTVVKNCWKTNMKAGSRLPWYVDGDPNSRCVLTPGVPYYWNIINANVTNVTPTGGTASSTKDAPGSQCTAATCRVGLEDGPQGW